MNFFQISSKASDFKFSRNNFDIIRLLAALQVVMVHSFEHLNIHCEMFIKIIGVFPGVPIFFITSGYLICSSLNKSTTLKEYLFKRAVRIFPALWVSFILCFIFLLFAGELTTSFKNIAFWIITQISFMQFYNPEFLRGFGVGVLNGSLWTIPIEMQFYIFLPLMVYFANKTSPNKYLLTFVFIVFCIFNSLFFSLFYSDSLLFKLIQVSILPYVYLFMIGIFAFYKQDLIEKYLKGNFILIALIYALYLSIHKGNVVGNYISPLQAVILCGLVFSFAYSEFFLLVRIRQLIKGYDISYGIYIYHMIFINILLEYYSDNVGMINLFLAVSLTFIFASLSWIFIEKPALKFKSKNLGK